MEQLTTLYHRTGTGRLRVWNVTVEGVEMIVSTGDHGGKQVLYSTTCSTTERACLEAERKWTHKKDREGYTEDESGEVNVFFPMLAGEFIKVSTTVNYPAFVQPKLDGVRCLVYGDPLSLKSRHNSSLIGFTKIERDLLQLFSNSSSSSSSSRVFLDGELYSHSLKFQEISGIVRDISDWTKKERLTYYIYDCYDPQQPDLTFRERYALLRKLFGSQRFECLVLLSTLPVDNELQVQEHKTIWSRGGFEGAIWRASNGRYVPNYRSMDLLKLKDFHEEEYEIVGFKEGQGSDKGTVIWACKHDPSGRVFHVRPEGTRIRRKAMFLDAAEQIGKLLTVKFQDKTLDGLPRFPIGKGVRDYE